MGVNDEAIEYYKVKYENDKAAYQKCFGCGRDGTSSPSTKMIEDDVEVYWILNKFSIETRKWDVVAL